MGSSFKVEILEGEGGAALLQGGVCIDGGGEGEDAGSRLGDGCGCWCE